MAGAFVIWGTFAGGAGGAGFMTGLATGGCPGGTGAYADAALSGGAAFIDGGGGVAAGGVA